MLIRPPGFPETVIVYSMKLWAGPGFLQLCAKRGRWFDLLVPEFPILSYYVISLSTASPVPRTTKFQGQQEQRTDLSFFIVGRFCV